MPHVAHCLFADYSVTSVRPWTCFKSLSSTVTLMRCRVLRKKHNPIRLPCTVATCLRWFRNSSGRTKHIHLHHGSHHHHNPTQPQPSESELLPTGTTQANNDAAFDDAPMDVDLDVFRGPSLSPPQSPPNVSRPDSSSHSTSTIPSRPSTPIDNNDAVSISRQYHSLLNGNFFLLCIAYQQNNAPYRMRL
jgi:hypothetical protein